MELITQVSIYWLISGFASIVCEHYFEEGCEDILLTFLVGPIVMPYFIVMEICTLGSRIRVRYLNWQIIRLRKESINVALAFKKDIENGEELIQEDILALRDLLNSVMDRDEKDPVLLELNMQLQTILAECANESLDK